LAKLCFGAADLTFDGNSKGTHLIEQGGRSSIIAFQG
jgi:hypothetical protein